MEQPKERTTAALFNQHSAIELTFHQRVTKEELLKSIDKLLGHFGCVGCGLNGHRIIIGQEQIYPVETTKFKKEMLEDNKALADVRISEPINGQF